MKKHGIYLLITIEVLLLALMLGFFLGRNSADSPIQISKLPKATADRTTESTEEPTLGLININTADSEQLQMLPGIGEVLAQRIIDYREEHGPFASISELTNVSGIGMERLDQIMDYITLGGS